MTCLRHPGRARVVHGLTSVKISVCLTRLICIHFMRHCCELLGRSYGLAAMLSLFTDQCHRRVRDKHTHTTSQNCSKVPEKLRFFSDTSVWLLSCVAQRESTWHIIWQCMKSIEKYDAWSSLDIIGYPSPLHSCILLGSRNQSFRTHWASPERVPGACPTRGSWMRWKLRVLYVYVCTYPSIYLALAIYLAI